MAVFVLRSGCTYEVCLSLVNDNSLIPNNLSSYFAAGACSRLPSRNKFLPCAVKMKLKRE